MQLGVSLIRNGLIYPCSARSSAGTSSSRQGDRRAGTRAHRGPSCRERSPKRTRYCDDGEVSAVDGPLQSSVADVLRRTADEVIRPRFRRLRDRDVEEKSPGEIVTIADRQAEAQITAALLGVGLGIPVVAEEAAAADPATLGVLDSGGSCWVLDPLDGTANFVAGSPDYGVQLALVEYGVTTAAWLLHPESGTLWTAALGQGAWRGSRRVQVSTAPVTTAELKAAVFTRFMAAEDRARHADRPLATAEVSKASVIDYPALVCGEVDLILYSRVLPWDHLPGALVITEAGGVVNWLDGSPYVPGSVGTGIVAARTPDVWSTASAYWAGRSS